jgi:hypothetical protein
VTIGICGSVGSGVVEKSGAAARIGNSDIAVDGWRVLREDEQVQPPFRLLFLLEAMGGRC